MKTVFEYGGPNQYSGTGSLIHMWQSEAKGKHFTLQYGLQLDENMTYRRACAELGSSILHHLACESIINNEGE